MTSSAGPGSSAPYNPHDEHPDRSHPRPGRLQITGQEEAMYNAVVTVTSKGRKNDLAATSGEIISIIRTTNCPKGKWLARNHSSACESRDAVESSRLFRCSER